MEEWRKQDPKYQEKTAGGCYFYSDPGRWGLQIDKKMYAKLPTNMKKAVVYLENTKTMDGNHAKMFFVDNNGVIQFFDEYGLGDFYYQVKQFKKEELGVVSDYDYDGGYKEGKQLEKKQDKGEPTKWITVNGKHIPVYEKGK